MATLVGALVAGQVGVARAEGSSADATSQATHLYEAGQRAAGEQDWERARSFFAASFRLAPHYQIAANLARTEYKLGRMRDAAEHFDYCLRHLPREISDADRQMIQKMFAAAQARVGTLTIASVPEGAEVFVDGEMVGKAPLATKVFVEPGERVIEARLHGYVPGRSARMVAAGEEMTISLPLEEKEKPSSSPGGGQQADKDRGGPKTSLIVLGAATSALALGMGIGFAQGAIQLEKERDKYQVSDEEKFNALEDKRHLQAGLSFGGFVAAGTVGLATLGYALFAPRTKAPQIGKVGVVAGPGGAGVTWSWTY